MDRDERWRNERRTIHGMGCNYCTIWGHSSPPLFPFVFIFSSVSSRSSSSSLFALPSPFCDLVPSSCTLILKAAFLLHPSPCIIQLVSLTSSSIYLHDSFAHPSFLPGPTLLNQPLSRHFNSIHFQLTLSVERVKKWKEVKLLPCVFKRTIYFLSQLTSSIATRRKEDTKCRKYEMK